MSQHAAIAAVLSLLASPAFAIQFECVGQEKGINTMTGKERVLPVTLHVEIAGSTATLRELPGVIFTVSEDEGSYALEATLGNRKPTGRASGPLGEFSLSIDKRTGAFSGESWLLSRGNIVTREGRCTEIMEDQ